MITFGMYTDQNWYKGMVELFSLDRNDKKIMEGMKEYITNKEIDRGDKDETKNEDN